MELQLVLIEKPENANLILGQSHFIKTVEDVHEALVNSIPGIRFGLAFSEASGPTLVRRSGTDAVLTELAASNLKRIGAGHAFLVLLDGAYPVNVLNAIKAVPEICSIFCATANPVQVVVAQGDRGRGILGVIDGDSPKAVETEKDVAQRKAFLRQIGYKL
jgi:adenosine/AMP kinase